ncbi:MAG: N-acetyltransferase [Rubrivivax sp.]|nr:N-acetyltransferase [Rubrivivax sp.]
MKIRVATPQDAAAVQAIYAPIVLHTPISFEEAPPGIDEMRERLRSRLLRFPWLVGEDEHGQVNGYVYAGPHAERAAYRWSVDVTVYVRQDCRRQGVGQRLYSRLFELLAALGYHQAFAGITLPNEGSVGLHEAMGFRPVARYRKVGFKLGRWHDVGYWQRELRPPTGEPAEPRAFDPAVLG